MDLISIPSWTISHNGLYEARHVRDKPMSRWTDRRDAPHLTQALDNSHDLFDNEVDLRLGREAAHAETQGRVRHVLSST